MPAPVGMVFPPWFPPERLRPAAVAAEEAGVDEFWVWEDCFWESGIAAATAVMGWTVRLRVGVGLLPVPLRNVALAAMEIATADRLFPGRFRPAVGHGVQDWMGQTGARVESPLTLLREYVVALDALVGGDEVTTSGRYVSLDRVRLVWPSQTGLRVMAGGVGPRTLEMLGSVAAGLLIDSGTSPAALRANLDLVRAGCRASGRSALPDVAVYVHAVRGDDAAARLAERVGPPTGDPDTERGLSGDPEEVAAGVRRYLDAGARTVVLRPPEDDADIEGFARWVGTKVIPAISD